MLLWNAKRIIHSADNHYGYFDIAKRIDLTHRAVEHFRSCDRSVKKSPADLLADRQNSDLHSADFWPFLQGECDSLGVQGLTSIETPSPQRVIKSIERLA